MITLLSVNIEGYCSICEPTHLQLNQGCTILIKAPNGNGKSSIFGAIVWCIYGKSLKGISDVNTWKEVQPKDYSGTKVEVFFQPLEVNTGSSNGCALPLPLGALIKMVQP